MADPFIPKGRLLLVSITREITNRDSVYHATRFAWPVNRMRAESVDFILGCVNGIVEDVFVASEWLDATKENFPHIKSGHTGPRLGFEGKRADEATRQHYIGKRVPDSLKIGQNGFRYFDGPAS